ncbi:hypothetical protein [Streptomyces aurantiacus]|uniref:hypothetical protein n=1 Tax=Streptomyces aurantiacus TaxID=47760 RepID=UPI0012FED1D3|nr:hypothetical protein [Streptomyces aurantiacus]
MPSTIAPKTAQVVTFGDFGEATLRELFAGRRRTIALLGLFRVGGKDVDVDHELIETPNRCPDDARKARPDTPMDRRGPGPGRRSGETGRGDGPFTALVTIAPWT